MTRDITIDPRVDSITMPENLKVAFNQPGKIIEEIALLSQNSLIDEGILWKK
jgi:hypothetical protein